jgi:NADPH:quinone reductase-like Zn-dependent oxidoreductase
MRRNGYIYAPKFPFIPGYESVGVVDAIGTGVSGFQIGDKVAALLVHGGYATHVVRKAEDWIPVPAGLDDADVAAVILNYVTAYQMIHRIAQMKSGQTALVTAASGGVGQALIQLLRALDVRVIAAASASHHDLLREMSAEPVEGRQHDLDKRVLALAPDGVDAAFDCVGGTTYRECVAATRRGGIPVLYGFMSVADSKMSAFRNFLDVMVGSRFRGRRGAFYGITREYRRDPSMYRLDLPVILQMLLDGRIRPRIVAKMPLMKAADAQAMLEAGGVCGKIVLVADPVVPETRVPEKSVASAVVPEAAHVEAGA